MKFVRFQDINDLNKASYGLVKGDIVYELTNSYLSIYDNEQK